jgi:carbonic anhydrase
MDARLNPYPILGLSIGDAHVIRNAGGVITDDEIRSLAISQHLLGTEQIMLIHHTDCGMLTFSDSDFEQMLEEEAGRRPEWRPRSFSDLEGDVATPSSASRKAPSSPRRMSCGASSTT